MPKLLGIQEFKFTLCGERPSMCDGIAIVCRDPANSNLPVYLDKHHDTIVNTSSFVLISPCGLWDTQSRLRELDDQLDVYLKHLVHLWPRPTSMNTIPFLLRSLRIRRRPSVAVASYAGTWVRFSWLSAWPWLLGRKLSLDRLDRLSEQHRTTRIITYPRAPSTF